jgi:hypothetical protein
MKPPRVIRRGCPALPAPQLIVTFPLPLIQI